MIKSMLDDDREIQSLSDNIGKYTWAVGKAGVTSIKCYGEPGHMAMIPWFAIYINGFLKYREDSYGKSVVYEG